MTDTLALNSFGFNELTAQEMFAVDGGGAFDVIGGALLCAAGGVLVVAGVACGAAAALPTGGGSVAAGIEAAGFGLSAIYVGVNMIQGR